MYEKFLEFLFHIQKDVGSQKTSNFEFIYANEKQIICLSN